MEIKRTPKIQQKPEITPKEPKKDAGMGGRTVEPSPPRTAEPHVKTLQEKAETTKPQKTVREYVKEFKALTEKSTDLLRTYAGTRQTLIEAINRDKLELTNEQKSILAELDKKTNTCIERMMIINSWLTKAALTARTDKLEKICLATSEYVVDVLDKSTQEYVKVLLRIFSEEEDLKAQLESLETTIDKSASEKAPKVEERKDVTVAATPVPPTPAPVETKPWTYYEYISTLIYGPTK